MECNFLTLDVEEWFDAEIPRRKLTSFPDNNTNIEDQIDLFLDICNRLNIKSTCFVVGKLAEKKPHIVKKLHAQGHEIASHSYGHKLIYSLTTNEFVIDLRRSIDILEAITGEKVKGFRAPSWSVNINVAQWFYKALEEAGIEYSSSVFPARTFLYGMPESSEFVHRYKNSTVIEIPQQILNLCIVKTGVTGGTYMRIFPSWFISHFIQRKNRQGHSVFIYLHPWELIFRKYPVELSFPEKIIQYWGVRNNERKLEKICSNLKLQFERMDKFIENLDLTKLPASD